MDKVSFFVVKGTFNSEFLIPFVTRAYLKASNKTSHCEMGMDYFCFRWGLRLFDLF